VSEPIEVGEQPVDISTFLKSMEATTPLTNTLSLWQLNPSSELLSFGAATRANVHGLVGRGRQ